MGAEGSPGLPLPAPSEDSKEEVTGSQWQKNITAGRARVTLTADPHCLRVCSTLAVTGSGAGENRPATSLAVLSPSGLPSALVWGWALAS